MNAEVASGLIVVLVAELVEFVVATDQAVVSDGARAEEIRRFPEILLVIALLRRAWRPAERR